MTALICSNAIGAATANIIIVLAGLLVAGCATSSIEPTDEPPQTLALSLYTRTNDQRLTYFEITRAGELRYAGAMAAMKREGKPVTTLTPKQKQEIWNIIIEGKLHEAGAGPLFPKAQSINYDLAFNTGGFDHIVRSVDDEHPALKTLHDYLFKIQAAIRYDHPVVVPQGK